MSPFHLKLFPQQQAKGRSSENIFKSKIVFFFKFSWFYLNEMADVDWIPILSWSFGCSLQQCKEMDVFCHDTDLGRCAWVECVLVYDFSGKPNERKSHKRSSWFERELLRDVFSNYKICYKTFRRFRIWILSRVDWFCHSGVEHLTSSRCFFLLTRTTFYYHLQDLSPSLETTWSSIEVLLALQHSAAVFVDESQNNCPPLVSSLLAFLRFSPAARCSQHRWAHRDVEICQSSKSTQIRHKFCVWRSQKLTLKPVMKLIISMYSMLFSPRCLKLVLVSTSSLGARQMRQTSNPQRGWNWWASACRIFWRKSKASLTSLKHRWQTRTGFLSLSPLNYKRICQSKDFQILTLFCSPEHQRWLQTFLFFPANWKAKPNQRLLSVVSSICDKRWSQDQLTFLLSQAQTKRNQKMYWMKWNFLAKTAPKV